MKKWVFKVIYYPVFAVLIFLAATMLAVIFKDAGWEYPFRWFCLAGFIAWVLDEYFNRRTK